MLKKKPTLFEFISFIKDIEYESKMHITQSVLTNFFRKHPSKNDQEKDIRIECINKSINMSSFEEFFKSIIL